MSYDFDPERLSLHNYPMPDTTGRMPFGKHKGTRIEDLDPGYAKWMLSKKNDPDFSFRDFIADNEHLLRRAMLSIPGDDSTPGKEIEFNLMADQQQASDDAIEHIAAGGTCFRIQGGAGYGKSYALADIALRCKRDLELNIEAAASSYVASNNLRQSLDPIGVNARTLASALSLAPDSSSKKEVYRETQQTYGKVQALFNEGGVFAVDECSMVDDETGSMLLDAAKEHGGTLLLIGDVKQLPCPSQETDSILCGVEPSVELTISKRFEPGSPLANVEGAVRADPLGFNPVDHTDGKSVSSVRSHRFIDSFVRMQHDNPDDSIMALFYANADVALSNRLIRAQLFPEATSGIEIDERLRIQRTVFWNPTNPVTISKIGNGFAIHSQRKAPGALDETQRFYSGVHHRVLDVMESEHVVDMGHLIFRIPCYSVLFEHFGERVPVLFGAGQNNSDKDQRGGTEFNRAVKEVGAFCSDLPSDTRNRWAAYHAIKNSFVQVQYPYASTIHKVQGQTLDRVFVPFNRLRAVCDNDPYVGSKLLYVAMTRAKNQIIWF